MATPTGAVGYNATHRSRDNLGVGCNIDRFLFPAERPESRLLLHGNRSAARSADLFRRPRSPGGRYASLGCRSGRPHRRRHAGVPEGLLPAASRRSRKSAGGAGSLEAGRSAGAAEFGICLELEAGEFRSGRGDTRSPVFPARLFRFICSTPICLKTTPRTARLPTTCTAAISPTGCVKKRAGDGRRQNPQQPGSHQHRKLPSERRPLGASDARAAGTEDRKLASGNRERSGY